MGSITIEGNKHRARLGSAYGRKTVGYYNSHQAAKTALNRAERLAKEQPAVHTALTEHKARMDARMAAKLVLKTPEKISLSKGVGDKVIHLQKQRQIERPFEDGGIDITVGQAIENEAAEHRYDDPIQPNIFKRVWTWLKNLFR